MISGSLFGKLLMVFKNRPLKIQLNPPQALATHNQTYTISKFVLPNAVNKICTHKDSFWCEKAQDNPAF